MFAVIAFGGKQYTTRPKEKIILDRVPFREGEECSFEHVLLRVKNKNIEIGTPYVTGGVVRGRVLKHKKGEKFTILKYKAKKRYKKKKGARASFTEIEILGI